MKQSTKFLCKYILLQIGAVLIFAGIFDYVKQYSQSIVYCYGIFVGTVISHMVGIAHEKLLEIKGRGK
jgi:hypothetical protein